MADLAKLKAFAKSVGDKADSPTEVEALCKGAERANPANADVTDLCVRIRAAVNDPDALRKIAAEVAARK